MLTEFDLRNPGAKQERMADEKQANSHVPLVLLALGNLIHVAITTSGTRHQNLRN